MDSTILACLTAWARIPEKQNRTSPSFAQSLVEEIFNSNFGAIFDTVLKQVGLSWNKHIQPRSSKSVDKLETALHDFVNENSGSATELLILAVSCLQCFVQANFTGPVFDESLIPDDLNTGCTNDDLLKFLTTDGEPAYIGMSRPDLLVLSRVLLESLSQVSEESNLWVSWWAARCYCINQAILTGPANSLHEKIFHLFPTLENCLQRNEELDIDSSLRKSLVVQLYAEKAKAHIMYDENGLSDLTDAERASGLITLMTGMKGKRTKYQMHETTQLVFLAAANQEDSENRQTSQSTQVGPHSLALDSDLLLEKPNYSIQNGDEVPEPLRHIDPSNPPALPDIDTALVLLRTAHIRRTTAFKDKLIGEELMAMVESIIRAVPEKSVNWTLFSRALWERSLLEADSARTVERGVLQMQSLVEELGYVANKYIAGGASTQGEVAGANTDDTDGDDRENTFHRLQYFHLTVPLAKWSLDSALADKFMSIGALKSAVEVYERLQMWGDLALCYAAVGETEKGVALLKNHIKKHPSDARSISILGDITCDPELWQRAWDVGKYPASKRSLGRYFYSSRAEGGRNLELCIQHLRDALTINPLNEPAWFLYGCAGLELTQWDLAAEAFTRCVSIDHDNPKAWSNLATAQLNLDKKEEALSALRQATRLTGQEKLDWRIWSNYVAVACDLDQWNDVILGIRRIIALRGDKDGEDCLDYLVLNRLAQVLVGDRYIGDVTKTGGNFQKATIDLFTNQIPKLVTANSQLWRLIAKVHIWLKMPWAALEDFEKGFRIYTHVPDVETDESKWNEAVDYCSDLVDAYRNYGPMDGKYGSEPVCKNWSYKAKSAVRLLMGRGKQSWEGTESWDRLVGLKDDL